VQHPVTLLHKLGKISGRLTLTPAGSKRTRAQVIR
jgi:hypothetical protein